MTSLPEWLVERAALDEVPAASRSRIDRADPAELGERIAALRADDAAELAAHPVGPAVARIEARIAATGGRVPPRSRRLHVVGIVVGAAAAVVIAVIVVGADRSVRRDDDGATSTPPPTERVKGPTRLIAFRQAGDRIEQLAEDSVVGEGDVIQLRYRAGGRSHGVIASLDGAGVVTLHYPADDDAPPEATALSAKTTALPNAYALDDAPRFERFFFITADHPIDVSLSLDRLRDLARRDDSATAPLELPADLHQWSIRLRKKGQP